MSNFTPFTTLNPPPFVQVPTWKLPLSQFQNGINEQLVNVSIQNSSYTFYFQNNVIENNLFLSVYGVNQSPIYFGSYRCVFGDYINFIDNGFPYLIFFVDTTNNGYTNITFQNLNNGVNMYAKSR
jgi:hypothetical protein